MLRSLVHNRDIIAANYNELEKNKKNSCEQKFNDFIISEILNKTS